MSNQDEQVDQDERPTAPQPAFRTARVLSFDCPHCGRRLELQLHEETGEARVIVSEQE
jgi:hypothetical protein